VSPGASSNNVSGVVVLSFTCAIPDRQRLMKAYERSPYPPMVRATHNALGLCNTPTCSVLLAIAVCCCFDAAAALVLCVLCVIALA
jgi:hypothetical protein